MSRDGRRGVDVAAFRSTMGAFATGVTVVTTVAHVDCKVRRIHAAGDHVIVVGAVIGMSNEPDAAPLLFHRGRYRVLADAELNSPASPALTVR